MARPCSQEKVAALSNEKNQLESKLKELQGAAAAAEQIISAADHQSQVRA
jgi:hypothetical protein